MTRKVSITMVCAAILLVTHVATPAQDTGRADFSRYIAVGDSLTAGFWSLGVSETQQRYSYPALIHRQAVGAHVEFEQALVSEPGHYAQLELVALDPPELRPKSGPPGVLINDPPRPFDNLGVVGADVGDVLRTECGEFFDFVLRNDCPDPDEGTTVLEQAVSQQPTFVTVWIGANDALGTALSGRIIPNVTLTELDRFTEDFNELIDTLVETGADLALATVPAVTIIPFASTVPWYREDPETGDPLLDDEGRMIPLYGIAGGVERALTAADAVLLSADPAIEFGLGVEGNPLTDSMVLDAEEVAIVRQRVDDFNTLIRARAAEVGASLFDAAELFSEISEEGLSIGGIDYNADFLTGGLFSYDGIHPSVLGYAIVANEFIASINAHYGARIPQVDLMPFVLGDVGGVVPGVPASLASDVRFTEEAVNQLRAAFGIGRGAPGEIDAERAILRDPARDRRGDRRPGRPAPRR